METYNNFYDERMQEVSTLLSEPGYVAEEGRVSPIFFERQLFSKPQRDALEELSMKLDPGRERLYCYSGGFEIRRERNQFGGSLFLCFAMNKSGQYILYFKEEGLIDSPCLIFDASLAMSDMCKMISEVVSAHTFLYCKDFAQCPLCLQVGYRVIMLSDRQNPKGGYFYRSGDFGTVEEISLTGFPWVKVRFDNGATHRVETLPWDRYEQSVNIESATGRVYVPKVNGNAVWLPLKLADLII